MPVLETKGAASAQGFGLTIGGAAPVYIEDVFSTWLIKPPADFTNYSINNGIDLLGKGGMTWFKARNAGSTNNLVYDTVRGSSAGSPNALITNSTAAQQTAYFDYVTPNTNGFTVNYLSGGGQLTNSGINYASWTFRKQPKFFDIVTYTGDGTASRVISHNLGSEPGFIIKKATNAVEGWNCQPVAALGYNSNLTLNNTNANTANGTTYLFASGNSTTLTTAVDPTYINATGVTYVVYLFAHNAGGFGLTGTDNVISCGSYTGTGAAGNAITLGYEPQWILAKASTSAQSWQMFDVMRGMPVGSSNDAALYPNLSNAEAANENGFSPTATGFVTDGSNNNLNGVGYIYIAIRRGPMRTPTTGTSVFAVDQGDSSTTNPQFRSNFVNDLGLFRSILFGNNWETSSRLQGSRYLRTNTTDAEAADADITWDFMNGFYGPVRNSNFYAWMFRRAPSFFDVVCYTGTGATTAFAHNLGVAPELAIYKVRNGSSGWVVYAASQGISKYAVLNSTVEFATDPGGVLFGGVSPTSTQFTVGSAYCASGSTYVAYFFASCPGVSKVGSYTGTGATQTVSCGFTGGARFVMIKRTDVAADWFVWDTARGMVSGTDPWLQLNTTNAEFNTNSVYTTTGGFQIVSTAAGINASGGTYIFLAIA